MTEVRAGASPGEIEQQDEAKNRELGATVARCHRLTGSAWSGIELYFSATQNP
jgi:hypothetical protein